MIAAGLLVACGTSQPATLRISGDGGIGPALSRADLRYSRAVVDPRNSQPELLLELTPSGQRKFRALTTNLARAGQRHHRPVHVLVSVDGRVISKPYIRHQVLPRPNFPAAKGLMVDVASNREAHDLAAKLNR